MGTETRWIWWSISDFASRFVKLNNPLMGTETNCFELSQDNRLADVKLNNPLMGTETSIQGLTVTPEAFAS